MSFTLRPAQARGFANFGWLKSYHSFSFGDYYEPAHMGFGPLRVINEDRVAPKGGFPTHPHQDMEILTYVLSGALEHRDSLGNGSLIRAGDVQHMHAGTGIRHSEYNPSSEQEVHFLQIWLHPKQRGLAPGYQQLHFSEEDKKNRLTLIAAGAPQAGVITVAQDVSIYASHLFPQHRLNYSLKAGRLGWLQLTHGQLQIHGVSLSAGDGLAIDPPLLPEALELQIDADSTAAQFLLFDLPA
jgi:quercetin 2,3-dioxygenase